MVKNLVLFIISVLNFFSACNSQNEEISFYDYFDLYSDFGISISKVTYRNSEFERNDVAQMFSDKYKGSQLSIRYHYIKDKPWSFNTGLLFNYMHPSKMYFIFSDNIIINNDERYFESELKGRFYVQLPISIEIKSSISQTV